MCSVGTASHKGSQVFHARQPYENLGVVQEYEVKDNKSTVAVTAGDKAFIFWRVSPAILNSIFLK